MKWLCCQLGAREHYAIPRALFRLGVLEYLLTDAWVRPSSFVAKVWRRGSTLGERFHNDLRDARVKTFNSSLVLFEMLAGARDSRGWPKIVARNRWFQRKVVSFLRSHLSTLNSQLVLCSYSYTALEPFRYAKAHGWETLLVQIDPGPVEEEIVRTEHEIHPEFVSDWRPAPVEYWQTWRQELELADKIVVNSDWARTALEGSGVNQQKLAVIPLAYEPPADDSPITHEYPDRFTLERPLRVLFLGQVNLRKGVARLLQAARILCDEPVEFWMVGPVEIANASAIGATRSVKWFGPVTRNQATGFYRNADVFILPTLSDGFAITQVEAQAHSLPVISSKCCGCVVENGRNGIILEEPSAACIAAAIRDCIGDPNRLEKLASASRVRDEFTIKALGQRLQQLGATL
jgi:glycosyltransferase involved in cell wall biosynthesis